MKRYKKNKETMVRVFKYDLTGTDKWDIRLLNRVIRHLDREKIEWRYYRNNTMLNILVNDKNLKKASSFAEIENNKLMWMMVG